MSNSGPLEGIRVLELAGGVAGPHAGKLLADYGATVTKVEPPGGDRARHEQPYGDGPPNPETSPAFLWLNTNKRSIVADIESEDGRDLVRRLIARSHVVIEDFAPGRLAALGLAPDDLMREHPGLVVCSITPFGQDGPYAQLPESDLVLQAMGGEMYATGHADREPLRLAGDFALTHAGIAAALAVTLAVLRQEQTGVGEHIDCSIYETQAGGKDRRQLNLLAHAWTGHVARRRGEGFTVASGVRPCTDGYINLLGGQRLPQLLRMVGREDLAARPELSGQPHEMPRELIDEIETAYLAWTTRYTMREALAIAQEHRVLGGAVYTVADALDDPTYRERGAFERIEHPEAGALDYPSRPFIMSETPRPPARRAPLLDEHRAEVLKELTEPAPPAASTPSGEYRLPLEGVRVIDLSVVWAGPFAGQLLAEWGAEVIRMEPVTGLQPQTRSLQPRAGMSVPVDGVEPWNAGFSFNSSSHNKRSFAGDIRTPEGREAFLRLVAVSDVIVENNVPETIDRLGISYEEMRAINPRIIFTRMPGFGLTGPYANYRAWGNHLEAMVGFLLLRAYPDATPDAAGEDYACDSVAGLTAAFATAAALRHRARSGRGQLIEVPQIEAFMAMVAPDMLDYQMRGTIPAARGNDHLTHAPHNAYRCAGDDRWIAIDVADDEQWLQLCDVLELHAAKQDARFREGRSRWEHRREVDRLVADAVAGWDRWRLFEALVAAGVPAGPVQDDADCFHCRHLRSRGWFRRLARSDIGSYDHPGSVFRWEHTPNPFWRAAVRLGEDNEYVYREVLGYDAQAYEALVAGGQVGTRFTDEVLRGRTRPTGSIRRSGSTRCGT
jgi:crotonobetainyl-CoA:carnitine CoA-transferase CaiB-like acyl-CoA transferase